MEKKKQKISIILCLVLLCMTFQSVGALDVSATGDVGGSISQQENEISEAQQEKALLQSDITDLKKVKDKLEASKKNLTEYVKELDTTLEDIQDKVTQLESLVEQKKAEIQETQAQLEAAKVKEAEQYEAMKTRIRFMYEKGTTTYVEILCSASSYGELLNKAEYINQLSTYDRNMLVSYQETKETIAAYETELEGEQQVLEEAKEKAAAEQANMVDLISVKQEQIEDFEADISNKEEVIAQYEKELAEQTATIAAMEKAVAARKAASVSGNTLKYGGGAFAWPAPSYTKISSEYGNRLHPILNVQQFHNGVDMAAPNGSPILAAYDGVVVAAAYSGAMGNYIMIDHGSGLYTIYMHASSLQVSAGTSVAKGQTIGTVGSTGRSTGPHLHFSVRLNGSYVSPWNYL